MDTSRTTEAGHYAASRTGLLRGLEVAVPTQTLPDHFIQRFVAPVGNFDSQELIGLCPPTEPYQSLRFAEGHNPPTPGARRR